MAESFRVDTNHESQMSSTKVVKYGNSLRTAFDSMFKTASGFRVLECYLSFRAFALFLLKDPQKIRVLWCTSFATASVAVDGVPVLEILEIF